MIIINIEFIELIHENKLDIDGAMYEIFAILLVILIVLYLLIFTHLIDYFLMLLSTIAYLNISRYSINQSIIVFALT